MAGDLFLVSELVEATHRIAELERKLDNMFRPGRVHEREYDEEKKRWHVRLRVGGTEQEPMLGPWVPYSQIAFGDDRLNVHYVPKVGSQMISLAPSGDYQQAVAVPLTWWDDHPSPSQEEDEVVLTFDKIKVTLKDNKVTVEADNIDWIVKEKIATTAENMTTEVTEKIETNAADVTFEVENSFDVQASEATFEVESEFVAEAGGNVAAVTSDRVETVGYTYLGLENRGGQGPKAQTEGGPAKKTFAEM